MSRDASRRVERPLSRARLDGLLVCLAGDRRALEATLVRRGPLGLVPRRSSSRHPVLVEFWKIREGAVQLGGIDQHEAVGRAGSLWGGAIGAVVGVSSGRGLVDGFRSGAEQGARRVAEWSRTAVRALASYSELMVTVPDVVVLGDPTGQRHSFVLTMLTDGVLARWADSAMGFGYGKERGTFTLAEDGRWAVRSAAGRPVLAVRCQRPRSSSAPAEMSAINDFFDLPLLGVTPRGGLVQSWLRRSFARTGVSVSPVAASIAIEAPVLAECVGDRNDVPAYAGTERPGAVVFSGLEATVSYPQPR